MAYFSQAQKKEMAPKVKAICAKYGVKASLAVDNHSTVVLNIKSGKLDFIGNHMKACEDRSEHWINRVKEVPTNLQVNVCHIDSGYTGEVKNFLNEVMAVLMDGNYDNSDIQTDYFSVGWYVDINVGQWNKPYAYEI